MRSIKLISHNLWQSGLMNGNNTHLGMQDACLLTVQSNDCRKQIPFKWLEINSLSLMSPLINHPFLRSATSQVFRWVVLVGRRNLRGLTWLLFIWNSFQCLVITSTQMSSGYHFKPCHFRFVRFAPPCSRGPSRPPGKIYMARVYPSNKKTKRILFLLEDFWQTRLCDGHTFFICLQQCVGVFWLCGLWLMGLCKKLLAALPKW